MKDKAKSPVKPKSTKAKSANGEANGDAPKSLTNGHGKAAGMKGTELGPVAPASKSNGDSHKSSCQVSGSSDQHHFPQASHSGNEHSEPAAEEPKQAKSEGGRRNHAHFAPSVRSTKSHRSKWGDDDAEPLWEVKKREWLEVSFEIASLAQAVGDQGGAPWPYFADKLVSKRKRRSHCPRSSGRCEEW